VLYTPALPPQMHSWERSLCCRQGPGAHLAGECGCSWVRQGADSHLLWGSGPAGHRIAAGWVPRGVLGAYRCGSRATAGQRSCQHGAHTHLQQHTRSSGAPGAIPAAAEGLLQAQDS
jgi:hypothetical protein